MTATCRCIFERTGNSFTQVFYCILCLFQSTEKRTLSSSLDLFNINYVQTTRKSGLFPILLSTYYHKGYSQCPGFHLLPSYVSAQIRFGLADLQHVPTEEKKNHGPSLLCSFYQPCYLRVKKEKNRKQKTNSVSVSVMFLTSR